MSNERHQGIAIRRLLERLGACPEAVEWASQKESVYQLWYDCPDPEWLLVAFKILGLRRDTSLRPFAIGCAKRQKSLFAHGRLIEILNTAEEYATKSSARIVDFSLMHEESLRIADDIARTQDWNALRHSAIRCACDALRDHPWFSALRASRNGLRASDNAIAEAKWQVCQLQMLAAPNLNRVADRATRLLHRAGK